MNIDPYALQAITGAVILIAVSLNVWRSRSRGGSAGSTGRNDDYNKQYDRKTNMKLPRRPL